MDRLLLRTSRPLGFRAEQAAIGPRHLSEVRPGLSGHSPRCAIQSLTEGVDLVGDARRNPLAVRGNGVDLLLRGLSPRDPPVPVPDQGCPWSGRWRTSALRGGIVMDV